MKLTQLLGILAISLAGAVLPATPGGAPARAAETAAVLNQYCVTCHNERTMTANLAIDRLNPERVQQNPAAWEKVVRKLRAGAMPPPGSPRPAPEVYEAAA